MRDHNSLNTNLSVCNVYNYFADKLTNSEKEKFYRFIYSEFSDTDIVDLKKDNLANFIYSKFNLPHDLCEAIFKDYFSIYKKELDARQYENIMIQLYLIGNSILTQRIKAFQSCDQDHDSYVSEKELNERIRFMKNESKRHFTPGDMLPINDIMKRFDKNKDKKLNFLEFNQYVSKTSTNIL